MNIIITGSPYRAHTEPLFYANRISTVYDMNVNIVGVFMYKCPFEPGADVFANTIILIVIYMVGKQEMLILCMFRMAD